MLYWEIRLSKSTSHFLGAVLTVKVRLSTES
nr:MAG TPA: hypothetical protein [Caudoviricetes sp.]